MDAKQTPLIDLLESVPKDARLVVEHDQFSSSSHPVGRLCHEAAEALRAALAEPEQEPFGYLWPTGMHPEFRFTQQKRNGVDGVPLYTAPTPRRPAQKYDYRTRYDRPCYKCSNFYCPGNCADPYAALTPRKPEQECDTDPRGCWSVRCQLGKKCKNAPTPCKPLTDEEVDQVLERHAGGAVWSDAEYRSAYALARAIEKAHGIGEQK